MLLRTVFLATAALAVAASAQNVEQWDIFEATFNGPSSGNPYLDIRFSADFRIGHRVVAVDGFYDGNGVYKVRFMPDAQGEWSFVTHANKPELDGQSGRFTATTPRAGNRGPVMVRNTYHFGYADGTPYREVGTTAYAWNHQGDALEEKTLATLKDSPFNKMRMCVFPKHYSFNANEPQYYPFPRDAAGVNDYAHFNPEFFRHLEQRVKQLRDMGIEADLILFHPYDRWGYKNMPAEVNDRYLRYTVARLAAFRNVWWSMANEWDFVKEKSLSDWDRFFKIVQESDPYQHLRSIHNGAIIYDHAKPWVTHISMQSIDFDKAEEWLKTYRKPLVYDECRYEGNISQRWGNLSAQEMVRKFWLATVHGAYAGHGETYLDQNDVLWWSKGGVLKGESVKRIAFLRKILEGSPAQGINPMPEQKYPAAGREREYYLFYLDDHQPAQFEFELPGGPYRAEIIDPWEMTIKASPGTYQGKFMLALPGKPYQAVRFTRVP